MSLFKRKSKVNGILRKKLQKILHQNSQQWPGQFLSVFWEQRV